MAAPYNERKSHSIYFKANVWSGILFGLGMVAFFDEAVFHQLLHWHHFYDKSTTSLGLISDGLFHSFSWFATIGGLFWLANIRRSNGWTPYVWWGGVLLGAGVFQLYDGLIQHKLMRLHQIRYVDEVFVYDIVWNVTAAALIVASMLLLRRGRRVLHAITTEAAPER